MGALIISLIFLDFSRNICLLLLFRWNFFLSLLFSLFLSPFFFDRDKRSIIQGPVINLSERRAWGCNGRSQVRAVVSPHMWPHFLETEASFRNHAAEFTIGHFPASQPRSRNGAAGEIRSSRFPIDSIDYQTFAESKKRRRKTVRCSKTFLETQI